MSANIQYYILSPAVNTKETGHVYPAVQSYDNYDFNAQNSVHKLRSREFPDFIPDIRFRLAKGAKLCDMMGQATINAHGFLISKKLKSIFESAKLVPHKFYSATIDDKGTFHQYYWVHFVWNESVNFIDYSNSIFYIKKGFRNMGQIEINSFSDFQDKLNLLDSVSIIDKEIISFKTKVEYDIFSLYHFTEIYITDKLKNVLIGNNLTGIEISEASKISNSSQN